MDIRFVLVSPAVAGNVGASARALKTMGFDRMRIVASDLHRDEKAMWTAHGSREVLEKAEMFPTLEEAVADRDFVVATTARRRGLRHEYYPPESLVPMIRNKGAAALRVAVVFGREESGLSNAELDLCDCISSIPLASPYPSLNLSQAVMLYAYMLSPLAAGRLRGPSKDPSGTEEPPAEAGEGREPFRALKGRVDALLRRLDFRGEDQIGRRILERIAAAGSDDIKLLHSLCARLEKYLPGGD